MVLLRARGEAKLWMVVLRDAVKQHIHNDGFVTVHGVERRHCNGLCRDGVHVGVKRVWGASRTVFVV